MPVNKTAFLVGALAGGSIAVAAFAGAGMKLPAVWNPGLHGGSLIQASTAPVFAPPPGAPQSFADIFERVSPAVVSIHVTSKIDISALRRQIPGFENFPFEIVPKSGEDDRPPPKQQSSGSGFFISSDGYIVTNNHVVDGAEDIKVVTKDGTELTATVVCRDEGTDLAVLKVNGHDFPYVSFETAVRPRVGDWVVAVGNPFDLNGTATAGIVSAYNRDIGQDFVDYIQIKRPDHSRAWTQAQIMVWRNQHEEPAGFVVISNDITELKAALQAAERSEERLNLALTITDTHVWEMDYVQKKLFKAGAEDTFFERAQTFE